MRTTLARAARPATLAALCIFTFNAHADQVPPALQKSLAPYSIKDATIEGGALKITVNRSTVTRAIYSNIVTMGACSPLWGDQKKAWGSASISRVEVRNAIGAQGFAFQGGRKECHELGQASGVEASKQYLAAHTLVCIAGAECRERRPGEVIAGDE
ncbi:hypothetical protein [Burkholderia sp. S171]|uniref:hypothetical protein n=1 Tax=Burkholderia sp. S171 TaxID=1641860 RepID=UPI001C20BEFB|nr:hypothetical protein [Burkholderia sp. S171]